MRGVGQKITDGRISGYGGAGGQEIQDVGICAIRGICASSRRGGMVGSTSGFCTTGPGEGGVGGMAERADVQTF